MFKTKTKQKTKRVHASVIHGVLTSEFDDEAATRSKRKLQQGLFHGAEFVDALQARRQTEERASTREGGGGGRADTWQGGKREGKG